MKAMILAAGKGERMMPLTKSMPKPLLKAGGRPLIEYHIAALSAAGITEIVVNTARFGDMFETTLGSGDAWNTHIVYSHEGEDPKGTGGGVRKALPMLGEDPFILVNADTWTDYDYAALIKPEDSIAHLVLVNNPPQNLPGDFSLMNGFVSINGENKLTYSGIGIYEPKFFARQDAEIFSFVPALKAAIKAGHVTGEHYAGRWFDIGTPERRDQLNAFLS